MLGAGLAILSFVLLVVGLWFVCGSPTKPETAEPDREEPHDTALPMAEVILANREEILARFQLPLPRTRFRRHGCHDCKTLMDPVWVDSPDRPGARMAYCQKCGSARYDMLPGGLVLTL